MAATYTIDPQELIDRDARIEVLEKQLADANKLDGEQKERIGQLKADLQVAINMSHEQVDKLEDLTRKLTKAENTEKNLRQGVLAINSKYTPLQVEHVSLKKKFKAAELEIGRLEEELEYQQDAVSRYYNKAKGFEGQNARMKDDLRVLESVNHDLKIKGEQMSGNLVAVAEQWREPAMGVAPGVMSMGMGHGMSMTAGGMGMGAGGIGMGAGGMGMGVGGAGMGPGVAGGRKRPASELLEDDERMRRFSRMTR